MSDLKDDLIESIKTTMKKNDKVIQEIIMNFVYNLLKPFQVVFIVLLFAVLINFTMNVLILWRLWC